MRASVGIALNLAVVLVILLECEKQWRVATTPDHQSAPRQCDFSAAANYSKFDIGRVGVIEPQGLLRRRE